VKLFKILAVILTLLIAVSAPASEQDADAEEQAATSTGSVSQSALAEVDKAADRLAADLGTRLAPGAAILAASFVDESNLDESSPLGRLVSDRFISRLVQAGYEVKEVRLRGNLALRPGMGEFVLSREAEKLASTERQAGAVLYGLYTANARRVFLSARVARLDDGGVLASRDFELESREARLLLAEWDGSHVFERYVRRPAFSSGSAEPGDLLERDLTEQEEAEERFRLLPPARINP
jgi:TolB-like protein